MACLLTCLIHSMSPTMIQGTISHVWIILCMKVHISLQPAKLGKGRKLGQ